jgi:peptidoglycan/LPS O-acetylase OafA/YrhL
MMQKKPSEILALTGLRGVAATFVMLYHFRLYNWLHGPAHSFVYHGYLCVDLFFVLSGFVMAMTYKPLFEHGFKSRAYILFLGRRLARVYPLYLLITLVFFGLNQTASHNVAPDAPKSVASLVANIFLVQAWGVAPSYIGPAWSISTEWAAYMLFPLLVALTLTNRAVIAAACGIAAAAALTMLAVLPADITHVVRVRGPLDMSIGTNYGPAVRCIVEFTFGLLCWRVSQTAWGKRLQGNGAGFFAALAILFLLAIKGSDIFIVLLMPLLVLSLSADTGVPARVMGWRVIHWLGEISYSVYLVHVLTFWLAWRLRHLWGMLPFGHVEALVLLSQALITLIIATLTYQFIEKPGRRLLRRWFEPRSPVSAEGSPNLAAP